MVAFVFGVVISLCHSKCFVETRRLSVSHYALVTDDILGAGVVEYPEWLPIYFDADLSRFDKGSCYVYYVTISWGDKKLYEQKSEKPNYKHVARVRPVSDNGL